MSLAHDYLNAIVRRRREPMEPLEFEPDWNDKPRKFKVYEDATSFPLPTREALPPATVAAGLDPSPRTGTFTVARLGQMLRESYGMLGRRLGVQGNNDRLTLPRYHNAVYHRGTASGGGLYPAEIYWVRGRSTGTMPGVHSYSPPHHSMERLLVGDVSGQVRDAVPGLEGDQFLLVGIKFWKNAFKYNSFSYHVVTMDLGALLGSWQTWARAHGIELRPRLSFDELRLNRLLGLDTAMESVMAVVPLPGALPDGHDGHDRAAGGHGAGDGARVRMRESERSKTVIRFPATEAVHASIVADTTPVDETSLIGARPVVPHSEDWLPLPPPRPLTADLSTTLRSRRSSFGRFSARPALRQAEFSALLHAGSRAGALASDAKRGDGGPALTRLVAFVNHVDGLSSGVYHHDAERHAIALVQDGDPGLFLQRNYFLSNYNLEQAAAVLVVLARPGAAMDTIGPRGYRYVNAEVGAVAQAVYTASAALGVGCGAALGFDNVSFAEQLDLSGTGEWPLLLLMVGNERRGEPDFDYRLD
ncbi:nitroreductase family protein [Microbispora sp. CA-135349]|uniref:nitroreductase family protein n=1 Tax=Microbispora sp. CA-135349 TaxID=3239953 RepID=UPI003D8C7491